METGFLQYVRRLAVIAWPAALLPFAGCLKFENIRRMSFNAPSVPRRIEVHGEAILAQAQCGSFTLKILTVDREAATLESDVTVDLSAASGTIYRDSACTSAITSLTVTPGESTATFYYKNDDEGTPALAAADADGRLAPYRLPLVVRSPGGLSISESGTYDFGAHSLTTVTDKIFVVTNSGGYVATEVREGTPALAAPFSFKGGSYPGAGGTCGSSIESRASCLIVVSYAPTAIGISSDTIRLDYFDGRDTVTATRGVTGRVATVASVTISDGPTYDYGSKYPDTSTDKTFTLSNSGASSATSLAAETAPSGAFAFKGGSYPGTGGDCGSSIAGGDSCTVVVTFTPVAVTSYSGTMVFGFNDGEGARSVSRDLAGTGAVAVLGASPSSHDFGSRAVGTSNDVTVTITNSATIAATDLSAGALSAPFSYKGGSYPGTGGDCGTVLAASAICTVVITYTPGATGTSSDSFSLTYDNGLASQSTGTTLAGTTPAALDLTFNTTGKKTQAMGNALDSGRAVVVQSGGKIVVGGVMENGGGLKRLALARFTADGVLDTTFATSGKATTTLGGGDSSLYGLAVDSQDRLIAVGSATHGGSGNVDFAVVRFTADGLLDADFGTNGVTTTSFGATADEAYAVAVDAADGLVVVGSSSDGGKLDFAVAKYTSAGVLDTDFNGTGKFLISLAADDDVAYAVAINSSNGNIYAVGEAKSAGTASFAVLGLDSTGNLLGGFNSGAFSVDISAAKDDVAYGVAVQGDGKVVVTGSATNGNGDLDVAILRLETDGALDNGFGTSGLTLTAIGPGDDEAAAVALQADGKIVVAGYSHNGTDNDFAVVRYTAAGVEDTTFDGDGVLTVAIGPGEDTARAVALTSTKIVAAGAVSNGSNLDFGLIRLWK